MKKRTIAAAVLACCMAAIVSCSKTEAPVKANEASNRKKQVNDTYIAGTVPTGSYKITTGMTVNVTNKALGIDYTSYNAGALIKQLNYIYNNSKDWRIYNLGNGYHAIINAYTNMALTIGNTTEHTSVIQYPYGTSFPDNQQWKIEYQGAYGIYRIKAKQALTKGLHVDPSSTAHGATIKIQTYATAIQSEGYFLLSPVTVSYADRPATNFFNRTSGWTNGDGATSVPLSNGKVMWLMVDSHTNAVSGYGTVPCLFSVNNCVVLQPSTTNWANTAPVYKGTNKYGLFRSNTSTADHYNWISTGFELSGTAYIHCSNIKHVSGQIYPFHEPIDAFGKYNISTNTVSGYVNQPSGYRTDLDAADGPDRDGRIRWGHGFVKDGSYVYALGTHSTYIAPNLYLARFGATAAGVTGTWEYWNGSAFVAGVSNAAVIGVASSGAPFLTKVGTKWYMTSAEFSAGCNGGTQIFINVADNPWGPFNDADKKYVYTIPDRYSGNTPWMYWAQIHPEHTVNNELLLTYNLNGLPGCQACSGNDFPDKYRPRALRVPLALLD